MNGQIQSARVFVINQDGAKIGQFLTRDAISLAQDRGLDLVEVAPNASPPICRLMDFGKVKYDRDKARKKAQKSQTVSVMKEIRFRPNISSNDLEVKSRQISKFLSKGYKVKISMRFKRAELRNSDPGRKSMEGLISGLSELGEPEKPLSFAGNILGTVMVPR